MGNSSSSFEDFMKGLSYLGIAIAAIFGGIGAYNSFKNQSNQQQQNTNQQPQGIVYQQPQQAAYQQPVYQQPVYQQPQQVVVQPQPVYQQNVPNAQPVEQPFPGVPQNTQVAQNQNVSSNRNSSNVYPYGYGYLGGHLDNTSCINGCQNCNNANCKGDILRWKEVAASPPPQQVYSPWGSGYQQGFMNAAAPTQIDIAYDSAGRPFEVFHVNNPYAYI